MTSSNQAGQAYIVTDAGAHVYRNATTGQTAYVVTVTITKHYLDTYGNPVTETGQARGNITASNPNLHATFVTFAGFVNVPYSGSVASFTDDAPDLHLADYSATIDWGDGSTTAGVITPTNSADQSFIVTDGGSHAYAAATTGQEPYVVTVSITKNATDTQGFPLNESALAVGNGRRVTADALRIPLSVASCAPGGRHDLCLPGRDFRNRRQSHSAALENNPTGNPNLFYTATIFWGDGTSSFGSGQSGPPPPPQRSV